MVGGTLFHTKIIITGLHELTPADDLSDEAFKRIDRDVTGLSKMERPLDNVARRQQAGTQHGRKHRMPKPAFTLYDSVFAIPAKMKALLRKCVEPI